MIPFLLSHALSLVPLATELDPWEVIPPGM